MSQLPIDAESEDRSPLTNFSDCHKGIISQLNQLSDLAVMLKPAIQAHQIAKETIQFFNRAVLDHHKEEEKDLFPTVLNAAREGDEKTTVLQIIKQLVKEHRDIESMWRRLEPQLKKFLGSPENLIDMPSIENLVQTYLTHAKFEEDEFLPLSEQILSRNSSEMAALGLSIHTRKVLNNARRGLRGS